MVSMTTSPKNRFPSSGPWFGPILAVNPVRADEQTGPEPPGPKSQAVGTRFPSACARFTAKPGPQTQESVFSRYLKAVWLIFFGVLF